jgi:hypothetical protein
MSLSTAKPRRVRARLLTKAGGNSGKSGLNGSVPAPEFKVDVLVKSYDARQLSFLRRQESIDA